MTDDLTFYTNPMSRGRVIRWLLEEIGQPYETVLVDYPRMKAADYLAVNPMGKVPAIRHGGTVVTETAAICAYLADAFPAAGLLPPAAADRGAYYRWLFFVAGPVEASISDKAIGATIPPGMERMVGYGSLDEVIAALEGAVSGRTYVAGDAFTAADLYLAAMLGFQMQFGTIPALPAFTAYAEPLLARPAAVRARAIDDALIAAQQQQQQQ